MFDFDTNAPVSERNASPIISDVEFWRRPPLVIDFEGALVRGDPIIESSAALLRKNPKSILRMLQWSMKGRAFLKRRIAEEMPMDASALAKNDEVAALAGQAKQQGRRIVLTISAGNETLARQLTARFPFLDEVIMLADGSGQDRADALCAHFPGGFDYIGRGLEGLAIWRAAENVILADATPQTARAARTLDKPVTAMARPSRLRAFVKAARPHQWAKNLLVFAPMILAGQVLNPVSWASCALVFLALGLVASATYILNDLLDLQHDRAHAVKCKRPLASGRLSIPYALAGAGVGLALGLLLGAMAGAPVLAGLLAYVTLTLAYSMKIKCVPMLDALTLGVLFTIRLVIGAKATDVMLSYWLLTFSAFLFTSLSLAKRHVEIRRARQAAKSEIAGRGYLIADEPVVMGLGLAMGVASILVFVLYLVNEAFRMAAFTAPAMLWIFPGLLFLWIARIWILCARGQLDDDPVAFAVRDKASIFLGLSVFVVFFGAQFGGLA